MTFVPDDHPVVRPFRRPGEHPTFADDPFDDGRLDSLGIPFVEALPDLQITSAASLAGRDVPRRSWLVPDLVPDRQVTLLTGDGGVGKSLLALQLGVAVATGCEWIGTLPLAGPVLYLGAEDEPDEVHRRLADIAAATSKHLTDYRDLHLLSLAGEDAVLAAPASRDGLIVRTALWEALDKKIAALRPRLLILDNAADVFAGNEISRPQVRQFISTLRGAAIRHNLAVVLLAHPSLAGMASGAGTSGSTAWSNSVRSRLYLDRPKAEDGTAPDPDVRVLRLMKSNYATIGAETRLRWKAGMLRVDGAGLSGFDRVATEARADQTFLALLARLKDQGRDVSHKRSITFAPTIFAKEPGNGSLSKGAFEAAMNRLLQSGRIKIETIGSPSRRHASIVEIPAS